MNEAIEIPTYYYANEGRTNKNKATCPSTSCFFLELLY